MVDFAKTWGDFTTKCSEIYDSSVDKLSLASDQVEQRLGALSKTSFGVGTVAAGIFIVSNPAATVIAFVFTYVISDQIKTPVEKVKEQWDKQNEVVKGLVAAAALALALWVVPTVVSAIVFGATVGYYLGNNPKEEPSTFERQSGIPVG